MRSELGVGTCKSTPVSEEIPSADREKKVTLLRGLTDPWDWRYDDGVDPTKNTGQEPPIRESAHLRETSSAMSEGLPSGERR